MKKFFISIMPGIFLIGYNIGTGSLTSMSKAGANYGVGLLWAVLLSCLIMWYLINFFSRFTMVTGLTTMEAFRIHIHPAYAWFLFVLLACIILSALMAMIGLLADVVLVWSEEILHFEVSRMLAGLVIAILVFALVITGNNQRYEKLLGIMVAIMGVAFIGSAIWFFPGVDVVLKGFIPRLPSVADGSDNSSLVILASLVGTTVSVFALLVRSGQIKYHEWGIEDWKTQRRDATISVAMMFFLSAAVVITASATLHVEGAKMNHIKEMIPMLNPIFGAGAVSIFALGILAAGLSSHIPNLMMIPWLKDDMNGRVRTTKGAGKLLLFVILTVISILGVFMDRPVFLLLLSQAGISLVMPLALFGLMVLSGKKSLLGEYRPGPVGWVVLGLIACFSLFMSTQAIQGVYQDLATFF